MAKEKTTEQKSPTPQEAQTPAVGGSYVLDESGAHKLTERTQAQTGTYRTTQKEGE